MSDLDIQEVIDILSVLSDRGKRLAESIALLYPACKHMGLDYACAEIDFESDEYEFGAEFSEPWCDGSDMTMTFDIEHLLSEEAMQAKIQNVKDELEEKEREKQEKIKEKKIKEKKEMEALERREYERLKEKFGGCDNE